MAICECDLFACAMQHCPDYGYFDACDINLNQSGWLWELIYSDHMKGVLFWNCGFELFIQWVEEEKNFD